MRLDKFLSNLKYGTRKDIEKLIRAGYVEVNGEVVRKKQTTIDPSADVVAIGGEEVLYFPSLTLMMNKREGTVCTHSDTRHPTVFEDLDEVYQRHDLHIAGRLDKDATGLLILSTDGQLIHRITSPRSNLYKTYHVKTKEPVESLDGLEAPPPIEDGKGRRYQPAPAQIVDIEGREATVRIREGKFHQLKRMFASLGHEVVALKRIAIHRLELDETLSPGQVRRLSEDEKDKLIKK